MSHAKQLNARTQKWREMLSADIHIDPALLKKRTRKGVPAGLRILVWPRLINLTTWKKQRKYTYQQLVKQESISDHDICLDVPRTFPDEKSEVLRKSLHKVLRAICNVHPKVGYCQGMNFLTMRLLEIMENQSAFWLLDNIFETSPLLLLNYRCPSSVQIQNYTYTKLLHKHLKNVAVTLQQQNIMPLMYTTPWWITLFSNTLPRQTFFRVFECFLSEGYKIMYRAGLAIMKLKEKQIVEGDMEHNISYVGDMSILHKTSPDVFVETMFSFSLSRDEIKKYEKEYRDRNVQLLQKSEQDAEEGYKRRLETFKKYQEVEQEKTATDYKLHIHEFNKLPFEYVTWSD